MELKEIRNYRTDHELCCEYCVYQDLETLELLLFRKIPEHELQWYIFEHNENYHSELKAVKLQKIFDLEQAETLVKIMWDICKNVNVKSEDIKKLRNELLLKDN